MVEQLEKQRRELGEIQDNSCGDCCFTYILCFLQPKYSARSTHLGMMFINREQIALLESKFHS